MDRAGRFGAICRRSLLACAKGGQRALPSGAASAVLDLRAFPRCLLHQLDVLQRGRNGSVEWLAFSANLSRADIIIHHRLWSGFTHLAAGQSATQHLDRGFSVDPIWQKRFGGRSGHHHRHYRYLALCRPAIEIRRSDFVGAIARYWWRDQF